jgi:hypothetical protein
VPEDQGIGSRKDRRAENLPWMGERLVETAHADDVIPDNAKLGVEEDRYKVLLVRLVAGIDGDDFPPQLAGAFRAIHRIAGGGVLRESASPTRFRTTRRGRFRLGKELLMQFLPELSRPEPSAVEKGINGGHAGGNRLCRISREP